MEVTLRSRVVILALFVTTACGAAAFLCHQRYAELRAEAGWLMERSGAQAIEYANTLEGAHAESQLTLFAERRAMLERAHVWQRLQMLLILAAAVGLFASYALFLLVRLRDQLELPPEERRAAEHHRALDKDRTPPPGALHVPST